MKVKVENIDKNVVQLEIEVDAEKFAQGMQKSFLKNAKKYNIPGFRKGKAPRHLIERNYGEQVFYEDAINIICPDAYDEAIAQEKIEAVDKPEIDIKQIESGKIFIFTAKVTTKPVVELGEYKGVEVKKIDVNVSEEDVEKAVLESAEKNSRMITIEDRGIITGDIAIIDFEGFIDGVAFEGGKGKNHELTIGSGQFIPGFEEQLIGAKTGDELDVNVSFPEDYGKEELSGKPALFKVNVKEIKVKELPIIDDEFAKDISEFDTLAEYREDLKNKLTLSAEEKAKHDLEESVVDKVVENASVEIPQVMIDKHIDNLMYDFNTRLSYQGLDLSKYLEIMGMDIATFRGQFAKRAEQEVKAQLIIEKVGKVEGITSSEEELETELKKMADNYKQDIEDFKKHLRDEDVEYIKSNLEFRKAIELLVENAKLVD
jgi:trigger factor